MHLHPPVSKEEILEWLVQQLQETHTGKSREELVIAATPTAESMALISGVVLTDEDEPLFP